MKLRLTIDFWIFCPVLANNLELDFCLACDECRCRRDIGMHYRQRLRSKLFVESFIFQTVEEVDNPYFVCYLHLSIKKGPYQVFRLLPPLKLVAMIYSWNSAESGIKHNKSINQSLFLGYLVISFQLLHLDKFKNIYIIQF